MNMKPGRLPALVLAGLALSGAVMAENFATAPAAQGATPALDPAAVQALDRMGAYLRSLQSFSLEATDSTEEVLENGQKIQSLKTVDLQTRKPNRLRADISTDRKAREVFYDGEHFTLLAPDTGYFVTVAAPPTIGEMLTKIEAKYGIDVPLVDLFRWGEDADAAAAVKEATVIGASRIDGQMADQYAFRQDDIDWQIWIAQGDAPLPLRYVITSKDEPGEPQYIANLSWNMQDKPNDAVFIFTPTKDNHPIAIVVQGESQATP